MVCHISFRDVSFHASTEGVRVIVITDVASHLFARTSSAPPWIHKKTSPRRGFRFYEELRFCFTVFHDEEQYEAGDTLEHTFWKPDWPPCTTKWLYFWGSIAGETCVSTSPVFHWHNDGIDPVPVPEQYTLCYEEFWPFIDTPFGPAYPCWPEPWSCDEVPSFDFAPCLDELWSS